MKPIYNTPTGRWLIALLCLLTASANAVPGQSAQSGPADTEAPVAEPARALNNQAVDNLVAFARLLGYVRHFHPSDEAAGTDWTRFAIEGVRAIETAADASDLSTKLELIFRPIAPTVRVFLTAKRPHVPRELSPPQNMQSIKITQWRHKGFGTGNPQSIYHGERVKEDVVKGSIPSGFSDPRLPYYAEIGRGVSCLVPLALFADAQGTLPRSQAGVAVKTTDRPVLSISGDDRATRLAAVVLAWNVLQHFYPYFDVVKTDWNEALREALTSAATDSDKQAFLHTLERMVAKLHDGHGNVFAAGGMGFYLPPVLVGWVENRLVVIHVASEAVGDLKPGDVIVKVDGRPVAEVVAERERLISGATPQWVRYRLAQGLMVGDKGSELSIEVQRSSRETHSARLIRSIPFTQVSQEDYMADSGLPKIKEVKPGVFYLNLDRIKDDEFEALLPKLKEAKGIIFDVRGYPKVSAGLIGHLIDKPVTSARWNVPVFTKPDQKQVTFQTSNWPVEPKAPRLAAKVAFITDGRAISYAETFLGIIENYKLGEIVGEATAGTNGNINPFVLPGGYRVIWTGMKVLKHDGSQHHGIGIKATVAASRTVSGVAAGRDEILERAIEVVSQ